MELTGQSRESERKTLIGVLASHDSERPNQRLASLFTAIYNQTLRNRLAKFHFVITGGTHDRLFYGSSDLGVAALPREVGDWLFDECGVTRLPPTHDGGVILLSYMISQRKVGIVWPFYAPNASHWQRNENLAFMRLCDQWHVKRLMNAGSVMVWFDNEADHDANRNLQKCAPELKLELSGGKEVVLALPRRPDRNAWHSEASPGELTGFTKPLKEMTVALIAHDEMKSRMIEFAVDHEQELDRFGTVLATGTTGREVAAATSRSIDGKMVRYHSGPKGGDIEIATAILMGIVT